MTVKRTNQAIWHAFCQHRPQLMAQPIILMAKKVLQLVANAAWRDTDKAFWIFLVNLNNDPFYLADILV